MYKDVDWVGKAFAISRNFCPVNIGIDVQLCPDLFQLMGNDIDAMMICENGTYTNPKKGINVRSQYISVYPRHRLTNENEFVVETFSETRGFSVVDNFSTALESEATRINDEGGITFESEEGSERISRIFNGEKIHFYERFPKLYAKDQYDNEGGIYREIMPLDHEVSTLILGKHMNKQFE